MLSPPPPGPRGKAPPAPERVIPELKATLILLGVAVVLVIFLVISITVQNARLSGARGQVAHVGQELTGLAIRISHHLVDPETYPTTIEEIIASPEGVGIPYDFFNATGGRYSVAGENGSWKIWSHGPDQDDDRGEVIYDPSNGSRSDGDIVRRSREEE